MHETPQPSNRQRVQRIRRVLQVKALRFPQLASPVTWNTLRRIIDDEQIEVETMPILRPARLVGFGGVWTMILSSNHPVRRHTYYAAHELGHVWLHVDDADGRDVCSYHFDRDDSNDPREEDAETVAAWLLGDRQIRSFLDVEPIPPLSPAATLAALHAAIDRGRIVSAATLTPRTPAPPVEPPAPILVRREPDRFYDLVDEIAEADSFAVLEQMRREIRREFANDARLRTLLREIDRQEEQLLEAQLRASRRS